METVEKRINLSGVDVLTLLGTNDTNLLVVENKFDASIVARGDTIVVRGEPNSRALLGSMVLTTGRSSTRPPCSCARAASIQQEFQPPTSSILIQSLSVLRPTTSTCPPAGKLVL